MDEQLFPSDDERKLNPMNFDDHFRDIIRQGGFDAIVGNPPWGASFGRVELAYLRVKFQNVIARMIDSHPANGRVP